MGIGLAFGIVGGVFGFIGRVGIPGGPGLIAGGDGRLAAVGPGGR